MLFAAAFFFVVTLVTLELRELNAFLHKDCTLPENICPFNQSVPSNSILGYTLVALLFAFGGYLLARKDGNIQKLDSHRMARKAVAKNVHLDMSRLEPDERKLLSIVQGTGAVFQSELVEKTGFGKVKVTRILDRLEGKGIVERKRRGMTNVVVIKG